ncbi:MAG: hypothetical protein JJE30_14010 [Desulfuromonadales bacterium]|nr:hypothetical protein [Desulfuromonadales bacterium]
MTAVARLFISLSEMCDSQSGWKFGILSVEKVIGESSNRVAIRICDRAIRGYSGNTGHPILLKFEVNKNLVNFEIKWVMFSMK